MNMLSQTDWENLHKMIHMFLDYGMAALVFFGLYKFMSKIIEGPK